MSQQLLSTALYIFRRDLRLEDNTALYYACKQAHTVIPCFIFDPRQVGDKNSYKSSNAVQFMVESLRDLQQQLKKKGSKLYIFEGIAEDVVATLIKKYDIDGVFFNKDYTPFSLKRDRAIEKICHQTEIDCFSFDDPLLLPPGSITTKNKDPYSVFTPFYKRAQTLPLTKPKKLPQAHFYTQLIKLSKPHSFFNSFIEEKNKQISVHGGTTEAKKIIRSLKKFADYNTTRDLPEYQTTRLSAHLKFGTISVRYTHKALQDKLGKSHPLIRQLYWRDFFTHVGFHSPFVYGSAFKEKYNKLTWSKNKKHFNAWCEGKTGFPLVDAGMRELNTTGFMHNRVRMVTASFLIKDLHINWLWGEKYFAQKLVDYDPAVNNGNWQWVASTGCDSQPYFRIFNPWLQQKKFDPACTYIKQWIPELQSIPNKIIHTWYKQDNAEETDYPAPLVDHDIERKTTLSLYKKVA